MKMFMMSRLIFSNVFASTSRSILAFSSKKKKRVDASNRIHSKNELSSNSFEKRKKKKKKMKMKNEKKKEKKEKKKKENDVFIEQIVINKQL